MHTDPLNQLLQQVIATMDIADGINAFARIDTWQGGFPDTGVLDSGPGDSLYSRNRAMVNARMAI